jgi:hypothetical protein
LFFSAKCQQSHAVKDLLIFVLGLTVGWFGYREFHSPAKEKSAPAEVASVSEPAPKQKPRYVSPLDRGAYDRKSGVASGAVIYSVPATAGSSPAPKPSAPPQNQALSPR